MKRIALAVALIAACAVARPPHRAGLTLADYGLATMTAGSNNNWSDHQCMNGSGLCRVVGDASGSTLTGLDQTIYDTRGTGVWLYNDGPGSIVIANDSASSLHDNRLHTRIGSDVVLAPRYAILFVGWTDWTVDPAVSLGWREVQFNEIDSATASTPTRSLGTAFQPSASRLVYACYSFAIDWTISVTGGQAGRIELLSDSANPPTTIRAAVPAGLTGTVVVGVNMSGTGGGQLCYLIRPGDYVLLRSVNVTSTPTYTVTRQAELLL